MLNRQSDPVPPDPAQSLLGSAPLSSRLRNLVPPLLPMLLLFPGILLPEGLILHYTGAITPVWVTNAVAVTALLRNARIAWPGLILVQIVADTVINLLISNGFAFGIGTGFCDAAEILAVATALRRIEGNGAIFSSLARIVKFAAVCLIVPLFSAAAGAVLLRVLLALPLEETWINWYLGDMFGLLIITPFLLLLTEAGRLRATSPSERVEIVLLTLLVAGVGWVNFSFTVIPGLFLSFPFLLLAALRGGLLGATSAAVALTVVASVLTLNGHGEIAAYPGATLFEQILMLQFFFANIFLSSLPVAVMLEQRRLLSQFQTLAELSRMARHDPLTELPNRLLFNERLAEAQAQARQQGGYTALLMIDLDRFKPVNDLHGHAAGDRLLVMVAQRLRGVGRQTDTVARLGGDEFAIVACVSGPQLTQVLAQRALAALSEPFGFMGITVQIGASIGIALNPAGEGDVENLIKRVDTALYKVKAEGRNSFRFYEPGMEHAAKQQPKPKPDTNHARSTVLDQQGMV
jgi:diguanylate cyclase (GGDEF)-like protein